MGVPQARVARPPVCAPQKAERIGAVPAIHYCCAYRYDINGEMVSGVNNLIQSESDINLGGKHKQKSKSKKGKKHSHAKIVYF